MKQITQKKWLRHCRNQKLGAETVCFGDIDIEQNGAWDRQVALSAGLEPQLPLWQENREALVKEFLAKGYTAIIKTVSKEAVFQ